MKNKEKQQSESFRVGAILAVSGGMLDAYTYICRGQVFANAQTGNIVLIGINAAEGNWQGSLSALMPVMAFVLGIVITEIVKRRVDSEKMQMLHWRHYSLALEIALLAVVMLIPVGRMNHLVNVLVGIVASIQYQTFRKFHGFAFATTMCTGNLRSGTEAMWDYICTGNENSRHRWACSYGIIAFFVIGAIVGAFLSVHMTAAVLPLVIGIYVAVFAIMTRWP